jgi:hypothetical protein
MSADGLMKAAGHRAGLDGQQLGVGVRIVSYRGEPLQRAPAVVELPLGVSVRAGCAHHHFDEDQQHVAVGGDQLLGQLEGVPAGLVVVDADDDVVKHAYCYFCAGLQPLRLHGGGVTGRHPLCVISVGRVSRSASASSAVPIT